MEGEPNGLIYGAIFLLSSFVIAIIGLMMKLLAHIQQGDKENQALSREIGRECHERVNQLTKEIHYEKGFREGRLSKDD